MDNEQGLIIYNTPDGRSKVALMARDGMVWLNQQSIAELFGTSIPNISIHISNIFRDKELDRDSVVKDYLTTAADGKPYHVMFYSLPMILAIGYKVKGIRGVQFRRWATPPTAPSSSVKKATTIPCCPPCRGIISYLSSL